jgi:mono/diheme cytochrome c family protein
MKATVEECTMKILLVVVMTLSVAGIVAGAVVHSGELLNFAADEPHPPTVEGLIVAARERFIADRSAGIEVPDLDDPKRIATGAAHYAPMCAACHLSPDARDTEIRRGLYPQPANLARPAPSAGPHGDVNRAARRQFWIIKHGIKMTAMPAWGTTHGDDEIWGLVAFVRKLPEMSAEDYARFSGKPKDGNGHGHEHRH